MQKEIKQPSERIPELDSLRGLAACAVLITHLPRGFWFGETGVDLFFVLSGYLISLIILQNRDQPNFLKTFYFRRSLRIFPIYYLVVVSVYLWNQFVSHPAPANGYSYYLFYMQNIQFYWGSKPPEMGLSLGHTWTLAIEEQFYLLWPAAILLVGNRRVIWLCLLLTLLPILLRFNGLDRTTLFGHTDGLALGGFLAYLQWRWKGFKSSSLGIGFFLLSVGCFIGYGLVWEHYSSLGYTGKNLVSSNVGIVLISFAYMGLIGSVVIFSQHPYLQFLRFRPLIWLGTISYGLYLYHWVIYEKLDHVIKFGMGKGDPWWLDAVKIVTSVVVAYLSWIWIEKPILRLKDRFSYRQVRKESPQSTDIHPTPSLLPVTEPNPIPQS